MDLEGKYAANISQLVKSCIVFDTLLYRVVCLFVIFFSLKILCIFRLDELIETFLEDNDPDSSLDVGADMRKIKYCFIHLKVFLFNIDGSAAGTENNLKAFMIEVLKEMQYSWETLEKGRTIELWSAWRTDRNLKFSWKNSARTSACNKC